VHRAVLCLGDRCCERMKGKRQQRLLITHIVESEGGAENDVGEASHAAPQSNVSVRSAPSGRLGAEAGSFPRERIISGRGRWDRRRRVRRSCSGGVTLRRGGQAGRA